MDQQLASEILHGDSDELMDIKANPGILEGFVHLIQKLDSMPDISKRFWEDSRSLYQATCKNRDMAALEILLSDFFGSPVKPADKPLPRKLSKEPTIKYLGGIQKEQSLFLLRLKTGTFYGALWPWRRNQNKTEIHLGYCSDWMADEDYRKLENLVKRSISQNAFAQMDTQIGGQIRGIGLPSFLQMAEMEQSSFSLRITADGKTGILQVSQGKLLAAQTDHWTGRDAAYRIISWDDAVIEITPIADNVTDDIRQPLMPILMESLKIKDEITSSGVAPPPPPPPRPKAVQAQAVKSGKPLVRLERIPPPPRPSRRRSGLLLVLTIVLACIVIVGAGGLITLRVIQNRAADYADFFDRLAAITDLSKKRAMLEQHRQDHPNSPYLAEIEKQIQGTNQKFEDQDFDQIILRISTLPIDEHYELSAISLYSDFLEKYPDSRHAGQINKSMQEIKNLVDKFYYEELKQATRLDLSKRLEIYRNYLQRFPDGRYNADVHFLIQDMGRNYLNFLKSKEEECRKSQHWDPCIERYEDFIVHFEQTALAREAQQYRSALTDLRDLVDLNKAVADAGTDFQRAAGLCSDFLARHPHTSQKQVVETELARLQAQIGSQRQWLAVRSFATNPQHPLFERIQSLDGYLRHNLAGPYSGEAQQLMNMLESQRQTAERQNRRLALELEAQTRLQKEKELAAQRQQRVSQINTRLNAQLADSRRYKPHGDGTVTDTATGAMWSLLDSYQELNGCIDYEAAQTYVKNLRHGGHLDWRLPAANELAALYKQTPFFPAGESRWYWTAEAYVKGFHTVVTIVTTKPETVFEREHRNEDQCGAVRAIRP